MPRNDLMTSEDQMNKSVIEPFPISHRQAVDLYEEFEDLTIEGREAAHKYRDYYDGAQREIDEIQSLDDRGQAPTINNRIAKKINYLVGDELEGQGDPKALPVTIAHRDDSDIITDGIRHVSQAQKADVKLSQAYKDKLIEGLGGVLVTYNVATTDIELEQIEYDRLVWDPRSRRQDHSDDRFRGIATWWTKEDAEEWFSKQRGVVENFKDVIEQSLQQHGEGEANPEKPPIWLQSQNNKRRLRITELYYKRNGQWHVCYLGKNGFLVLPKLTGYKDEKGNHVCPLILSSGYIDREGQRYGMVKNMMSPQDEINKLSSKGLHWQSVDRVIAEEGAVVDPDEAQQQYADPGGWVQVQRNALRDGRLQFINGSQMAQALFARENDAKNEIDRIGPDAPNITGLPNEISGKALQVRKDIGSREIRELQISHRELKLQTYRQIWYCIRQFWKSERWFRVSDSYDGERFVGINRPMTRSQRLQQLLGSDVPLDNAIDSLHVPEQFMAEIRQQANDAMQQQMQGMQQQMQALQQQAQGMQQQAQVAQQQGVPPEQLQAQMAQVQQGVQQQTQALQQQMEQLQQPKAQEQLLVQVMSQHPYMEQQFLLTDVATLQFDIVLGEAPASSVDLMEEHERLLQLLPTIASAAPDKVDKVLEIALEYSAHQSPNRKKLLEIVRQGPDPQQQQIQQQQQQLAMQEAQMRIQLLQAQVQMTQAEAAKAAAHAQQGIPAEVQLDGARVQEIQAKIQKLLGEVQTTQPSAAKLDDAQAEEALANARAQPQQLVQEDMRLDQEQERLTQKELEMMMQLLEERSVPRGS